MKLSTKMAAFITAIAVSAVAFGPQVEAVNVFTQEACNGDTSICGGNSSELTNIIGAVVNLMLFIAGIIAVIMIIVGGIKYITSNGDANAVSSAKNTVLYAVIGLAVAIMAFAIVNFVLNQFQSQAGSNAGDGTQQEAEGENGTGGTNPSTTQPGIQPSRVPR